MITDTEYLTMNDGKDVALHSWLPEKEPELIVVISHGMTEYAPRYKEFAETLVKNNIACYGHDHRGHGLTAGEEKNLGILDNKKGFKRVVKDLDAVITHIKNKYPTKKIFLLAHSFGSFVAQSYIEQNNIKIDGCILSGTAGPRTTLGFLLKVVALILCGIQGKKHKSNLLTFIAFGSYSKRIPKDSPSQSWLSRDGKYLQKYENNPYCGFVCTNSFYRDLGDALSTIHLKKNINNINNELPILFITGTEDPVGDYTKTVRDLANKYREKGMTDVKEIYYQDARHEPLNEINRNEVYADVINWINEH